MSSDDDEMFTASDNEDDGDDCARTGLIVLQYYPRKEKESHVMNMKKQHRQKPAHSDVSHIFSSFLVAFVSQRSTPLFVGFVPYPCFLLDLSLTGHPRFTCLNNRR